MIVAGQLQQQFRNVDRSAWRWECQGEYAVGMPEVQRRLDGETPPVERKSLRSATSATSPAAE